MFSKTTLVAVTLALMASALPAIQETGIRIPISKRALKNPDGTVNRDAITLDQVRTQNKHRENMLRINHTIGLENYKKGARIPAAIDLPAHLRKRQVEELTDHSNPTLWTGNVTIGSNAQELPVVFDTGSSDFWVVSSNCPTCKSPAVYDPSGSSTAVQQQQGGFTSLTGLVNGDTIVGGPVYEDTVTVNTITVTKQLLMAVDVGFGELYGSAAAGAVGLAWPGMSYTGKPFFWNAIDQGLLQKNVFGVYLSSTGGEVYLGGIDTSFDPSDFEYHDLTTTNTLWRIGGASVSVNGQTIVSNFETIIDTGSALIRGPYAEILSFYEPIDGAMPAKSDDGTWEIPCDSFPTVAFSWGDKDFVMSPSTLNLGPSDNDGLCQSVVAGLMDDFGPSTWVIGDAFLQNVYTAFDVDKSRVGFVAIN